MRVEIRRKVMTAMADDVSEVGHPTRLAPVSVIVGMLSALLWLFLLSRYDAHQKDKGLSLGWEVKCLLSRSFQCNWW